MARQPKSKWAREVKIANQRLQRLIKSLEAGKPIDKYVLTRAVKMLTALNTGGEIRFKAPESMKTETAYNAMRDLLNFFLKSKGSTVRGAKSILTNKDKALNKTLASIPEYNPATRDKIIDFLREYHLEDIENAIGAHGSYEAFAELIDRANNEDGIEDLIDTIKQAQVWELHEVDEDYPEF